MASRVPSHKRLKATVRTKRTFALKATFKLWNDRKFGQKGSTKSQLAEILLHQSVDKLSARCRSQEANDELKSTAGLPPFACGFKFLRWALTRICFNEFPLRCDSMRCFLLPFSHQYVLVGRYCVINSNTFFCVLLPLFFDALYGTFSSRRDTSSHLRQVSIPFFKHILKLCTLLLHVEGVGFVLRMRDASPSMNPSFKHDPCKVARLWV